MENHLRHLNIYSNPQNDCKSLPQKYLLWKQKVEVHVFDSGTPPGFYHKGVHQKRRLQYGILATSNQFKALAHQETKKKKVYFLWGKVHKRNICGKKAFWSQNQQLSLSACVVSALCSIYCGWHISNLAQFCIDSISSLTIWRDSSGFVTSKTTNNHFFSNQRSINQN